MDYKEKVIALLNSKELSQEQKEKLESIFPELSESTDERIRKECISIIKAWDESCRLQGDYCEVAPACIAWLEKQGEHAKFRDSIQVGDKVTRNQDGVLVNLSQLNRVAKPAEEYNITGIGSKHAEGKLGEMIKNLKPLEQKPADKVEPKFKVGDWIINRTNTIIMQIVNNENFYESVEIGGIGRTDTYNYVEWDFRLWTIQDAKDGDVLMESGENTILMFRGIGNAQWNDVIDYHCYYDCYREDFIVQNGAQYWGNIVDNRLEPATKEQCDLLFSKMKEAGYEWDVNKKELKNIKSQRMISAEAKEALYDKPAWSEEDEKAINDIMWIIEAYRANGFNEIHKQRANNAEHWLKSLKEGVQQQSKPVNWSEEDEKIRQTIINEFEQCSKWCCANGLTKEDCIAWLNRQIHAKWSEEDKKKVNNLYVLLDQMVRFNMLSNKDASEFKDWLKSLRPQSQWKPNIEQMKALEIAIRCGIQLGTWEEEALKTLKEQLWKLKREQL
jgi:hypothetical protein